ncbi:hypothetical protein [Haloferula rosea]|uniref:Neuromedin U n=1 Tax=Haloferula rosea TaxID=490093 RepID=A0A934R723_9BACT|nr:hypothetical protein [Haloferula rosea]MBK1825412.1 hypothetical protein [Haloferula rosea]
MWLSAANAQETGQSADEIAKELANPNTSLTSLKLQTQYYAFQSDVPGLGDLDMVKLYLQPTLPFELANGNTLWVRPGVPFLVNQPVFDTGSRRIEEESGLGDVTLDVQYGTTLENGFLWSIGASTSLPTATEKGLGTDFWTIGPGFQIGRVTETSVVGVFVNHQWDVAGNGKSGLDRPYVLLGPNDPAVSLTTIQFFGIMMPGNGWSFGTAPIMTYNHESDDWIIPLHLTVNKTLSIAGRPWEFSVDLNYYVETPDEFGPEWMVGFNIAPVVENVFARWVQ